MNTLKKPGRLILFTALAISSLFFLQRCTKEITPKLEQNDVYDDKVLSIINPQNEVPLPYKLCT